MSNTSIREHFEKISPCPDRVCFSSEHNFYEPVDSSMSASVRSNRQNNRWEAWQAATAKFKIGLKPKQQPFSINGWKIEFTHSGVLKLINQSEQTFTEIPLDNDLLIHFFLDFIDNVSPVAVMDNTREGWLEVMDALDTLIPQWTEWNSDNNNAVVNVIKILLNSSTLPGMSSPPETEVAQIQHENIFLKEKVAKLQADLSSTLEKFHEYETQVK